MEDEAELVKRTAEGDQVAFSQLMHLHFPAISAYVLRMLANGPEADDVIQETFLRLWNRAGDFNPETAKLTTWLHRVAHNLCIDHLRASNRIVGDDVPEESTEGGPLSELAADDQRREIHQAMMKLPERQRSAIILCHFQDMSNKQAAVILDVSVDALESLMARGRRRLRAIIGEST